jgi:hypothetical protein
MRTKQEVLNSHADRCFRRSALTTNPLTRHEFLDMAAQWLEVAAIQQELEGRSAQTNALASGSKAPCKILSKREAWLSGQRQAFEIAILGGALETTLGILIRTASDVIGGGVRAAFISLTLRAHRCTTLLACRPPMPRLWTASRSGRTHWLAV